MHYNDWLYLHMDFKLYVFKAVCEELSFSKAAERVAISQPAVSKNIKSLEEHYGVSLFVRKGAKIELSQQGQYLYDKSKDILNLYNQVEDHFQSLHNAAPEFLKLGCSTTLSQYLLPTLLLGIQKKHPKLQIELQDGNSRQIEQLISNQILDFGIVEGNHHLKDLKYQLFLKDEIVLIHQASTQAPQSISIQTLESLPLIRRELGSGTDEILQTAFDAHGIKIAQQSMRIGSTQAIKSMVSLNPDLYAFVSVHSIAEELKDQKLEIIDVDHLEITRDFNFITRQGVQNSFFEQIQRDLKSLYN